MARRTTKAKTRGAKPRVARNKTTAKPKAAKSIANSSESPGSPRPAATNVAGDAARLHHAADAFDAIADGIAIVDADWRIVAVNPAFTAITGHSEADVVGRPPALLTQKKAGPRLPETIADAV